MSHRFTIDGSEKLEAALAHLCVEACDGVLQVLPSHQLHALVLGGGYGRGEGGVLSTETGDQPYNDLEFYVVVRGSDFLASKRYGRQIHALGERMSRDAGIEVEFKVLALGKLERSSVTMFYYDLIAGHRLIEGPDSWFGSCEHHRAAHRIPLHEATRLLMNRCSGLLFAQERLLRKDFTLEDADFTGRNFAKAKLAFGDVLLTLRGQYHWSCRERQRRLKKLETENALQAFNSVPVLHEQGVEFKLHPVRTVRPQKELCAELEFLKDIARELWLYLESRRLGKSFTSVQNYSFDSENKCPETRGLKNQFINLRTFGPKALLDGRYPRERLLNSLPLLLWEPEADARRIVQEQLRTPAGEYPALVGAYESLWRSYN